jgi:pyruvate dehydrogenase E2 component (dihydrolipoamide acetyltransferase)
MDFKLPDIGEGVHEGEITKWLIQPGQTVAEDQPMVEVMTDKATVEIPSPVSGVVDSLLAKEGETVLVGAVILKINEKGKAAPSPAKAAPVAESPASEAKAPAVAKMARPAEPAAAAKPAPVAEPEVPFHVLATPATRKLARDLSVKLGELQGSGPNGRVTKEDVQLAYEGQQAATPRSSHPVPAAIEVKASKPSAPATVTVPRGALQKVPLRGIRKKISEAMSLSKHKAAHFTYVEEVDVSAVVAMRKAALPEAEKRGIKLTFLPFIMKALIPALKEFPYLNSSLDEENQEIVLKGDYNFGVPTDTPSGLMVPVIKAADAKSIWELAAEITALSDRARNGKSSMDDLKGGTFTLTNAGSIGGVFTTPVINYPEVAILGVNAIRKRPVVVEDEIVIRDMMFLSMSVDHRVVDGADAARFMNRLIYFLSEPSRLVFA